ncbi:MAG: PspC domain-containing protein [Opitutus sp.]
MNKVVTINLNGNAYQLEEIGYETLRKYLDNAARQLATNPDKDEIIADIEQAIGDKCRARTGPHRTVVLAKDVEQIIAEMGPVDDGSTHATKADEDAKTPPPPNEPNSGVRPVRRMYKLQDGAILAGVCNGIAAYFRIDPSLVRILFVVLAFFTLGGMAVAYLALILILPAADTPGEKAAAHGIPSTAQEFIHRAREGYYEAAKNWNDKHARRQWKRKFRREMGGWNQRFKQEMRAHSAAWQSNWGQNWANHPGAYRGLWFTLSLLTVFTVAFTIAWILAMISLLTTGAVYGIALPAGMPVWAGVVVLFLIYHFAVWPLRASRHALSHGGWGGSHGAGSCSGPADALVWFVFLGFMVWLADRYVPHAHDALVSIPPLLDRAAASVRDWWVHR